MLPVIALIVVVSALPLAVEVLRGRRRARTADGDRTDPGYPAPATRKDHP